jgi:2,3-bisphosphoglycerate-dependent phosphoglycerate mutase
MSTNLYFVRHAHSFYTPDELARPLSERGVQDARNVTELLIKGNIDLVISSPYRRANQTVEGIAKHINKEIIIEEDLKERLLSNKPVADFDAAITKVWGDYDFSLEGGESNSTAQKRGVAVIHKIIEKYKGKNIAIGTHGNIMVLTMNYFDQKYNFPFWQQLDMPDIYKLTFDDHTLLEVNRIWTRGLR